MPFVQTQIRRSSRKRRRVHRSRRRHRSHLDVSTTELQSQNNTCSIMDINDPSLLGSSKLTRHSQPSIRQSSDQKPMKNIWTNQRVSLVDYEPKAQQATRNKRRCCSQWSCLCLLLFLLSLLCLGIAIAAILIALLVPSTTLKTKSTTVTTTTTATATTSSTTTSTSISSTTSTSTSSTSTSTTTSSTSTSTTSTTTTSTSTSSSSTSSTTSTTTTDTTTTTTTTTTTPGCNSTCVSTINLNAVPMLARFDFENTYIDAMLTYNATPINSPTFTMGYVNRAVSFSTSAPSYLSTSFVPINTRSFTVDTWIYPTGFPNPSRLHTILGLCPQQIVQECLQLFLRYDPTLGYATTVFGVMESADLLGTVPIRLNTWTHIGFVYGRSAGRQIIYVNGVYDNSRKNSNGFNGTSGTVYIGNNLNLVSNPSYGANSFQGYMDQFIISDGIRSNCEIMNVATLASRFSFDNLSNPLDDLGANNVLVNASGYQLVDGVKGDKAIFLNSSSWNFFRASGFRFLSFNFSSLSIALWLQPTLRQGIIVDSSLGYSPLAFTSNGSLIARIDSYSIVFVRPMELAPIWTHLVMTWSFTNGLELYVNTQPVGNVAAPITTSGTGATANVFMLGGGSFVGVIDDWCIYSRELSTVDVCNLFNM